MQGNPLAASEQSYRLLVDAVVDYAIYLLDPEGRISSWNSGAQRIKGYAAEEVIGKPFSMFFTEEDRRLGRPEAALDTARREGRFEAEGWRLRKDGSRFWALAVLDAVRDRDGQVIGFAKVTRDMTERREAQQALLESERRFRLLVQGITDYAIFMLDLEGRVVNWDTGARRIKGYTAEEIVGQHFSRFYTEEDRATGLPDRWLEQARATGRFQAEGWRVRTDGSRFWASVVIDLIRDDDGAPVGFAKVTRDMTEQHEAQRAVQELREQMVQAQKLEALGQLTGGIAHNFNNLIQIVLSGIRLAERHAGKNEGLRRILASIAAAAEQRSGLTRHLLAFSRKLPTQPEVIDTAEHLRRAADLLGPSLRRDIRLDLDLEDGIWPIRVDVAQFELALLNVALNARDAMPQGGLLAVSARNEALHGAAAAPRGRFVAVRLRDTGCGIPREVLGRAFEPFFTTKPLGEGTGLGLSQAYGFADAAGGALRIESEPGRGTEVTFLLPAATAVEAAAEQDTPAEGDAPKGPAPPGQAGRVLVVDGEAAVGRLAAEMLEDAGYRAEAVVDPRAALGRLGNGKQFDLVFTDMLFPSGMSGVDLAREVGRHWPDLPVLLAASDPADAAQGGFPVLRKPYAPLELTRAVTALLRQRIRAPTFKIDGTLDPGAAERRSA
jgi:PAS domain S-box-containing protein